MKIFKTVLVDDEPLAIEGMMEIINEFFPQLDVLATCNTATQAQLVLDNEDIDLLFLDINLPGTNGLDFLASFKKPKFNTIFVTAYDHYAIDAIKQNAFDYILKPLQVGDIHAVLRRLRRLRKEEQHIDQNRRLALSNLQNTLFVRLKDIVMLKGGGSYVTFYFSNGEKDTFSRNLLYYENLLDHPSFFRSHQSFLVNTDHVQKLSHSDGLIIELNHGITASLSSSKKNEFLEKMS